MGYCDNANSWLWWYSSCKLTGKGDSDTNNDHFLWCVCVFFDENWCVDLRDSLGERWIQEELRIDIVVHEEEKLRNQNTKWSKLKYIKTEIFWFLLFLNNSKRSSGTTNISTGRSTTTPRTETSCSIRWTNHSNEKFSWASISSSYFNTRCFHCISRIHSFSNSR